MKSCNEVKWVNTQEADVVNNNSNDMSELALLARKSSWEVLKG